MTAPAVKVTVATGVIKIESFESVAAKVGEPAVVEVTVNVTTPLELEDPEAEEIESVPPRLELNVTVLPETGFALASLRVTVTVEVVDPLAVTDEGLAATVETVGLTAPTVKVTVAV